jgi:hypothetical protein
LNRNFRLLFISCDSTNYFTWKRTCACATLEAKYSAATRMPHRAAERLSLARDIYCSASTLSFSVFLEAEEMAGLLTMHSGLPIYREEQSGNYCSFISFLGSTQLINSSLVSYKILNKYMLTKVLTYSSIIINDYFRCRIDKTYK